jgi:microcystin-dependent protein
MNALLAATMPTGALTPFASSTVPTGWLLCDGQAVSRTTYAELFAIISTNYGTGNGTTTFNVPNLKGRVPVGLDSAQTEFDVLAETGGAKTHTLTTAQMPVHTHTQNAHTHTQDAHNHAITPIYQTVDEAAGFGLTAASPGFTDRVYVNGTALNSGNTTATNQNATATNNNAGSGDAHNNLQPYLVINYIIKI